VTVETVPLQYDMFTGQRIDTRTAKQKQVDKARHDWKQLEMFRQRDLAQFGVSANPVMDVSPGRLVLISEDPRTDEEKEIALRRAAEARTKNIFDFEPEQQNHKTSLPISAQPLEHTPATNTIPVEAQTDNPKLTAYLAVVQAMYERVVTTWIAEEYRNRLFSQLPLTVLDAVSAGLQASEIVAAVHIGQLVATPNVAISNETNHSNKITHERFMIKLTEIETPSLTQSSPFGYRKQSRQQIANVRFRSG
jgi:hypothetical protein